MDTDSKSEDRLAEIKSRIGHFEARKARARERLADSEGHWYFAIVGLDLEGNSVGIEPLARFQRVIEPPGEVELAAACKDPTVFGAVGRYSPGIRFELAVRRNEGQDQPAFNLAWWILSALRARTCAEILVIAVSDHSWSVIAGIDDQTCHVQLLEDQPRAHRFEPVRTVAENDLRWVGQNLISFADLLEKPQFRLAVDSLCTHHQMASKRMAATMLWSGVEALFSISAELRFRLASCIAATLEDRGTERIGCYRRVKRLYDFRSRLVHGTTAGEEAIDQHVIEVRQILSRLICRFTEAGRIPDDAQTEELLFG